MKYHVTLDGTSRVVERDGDWLRIDDARVVATPVQRTVSGLVAVRVGDRLFEFHAVRVGGGWDLSHGGRTYRVGVETERAHAIAELAGGAAGGGLAGTLEAPMPGLVIQMLTEPGQPVEAGDPLVIIEAMKMENELRADAAGVVDTVHVESGDTVNRGDPLISFAPPESQ